MFQYWFAPVIFLDGTAVSCLLLVKHYDQRCRLPYQKPSGHPAVLSSCSLFATSRLFLSSRTTWASPVQFKPKLFINGEVIKPIELGESFEYLGRWFNFEMNNEKHKEELTEIVAQIMNKIDSLPLHPKNKIMLYSRYLMSKLPWHLTIADIEQTWVTNQLDSLAHSYLRRWLEIPANGPIWIIMLSKSQFGLDIQDISTKFKQCQVVMRQCLKKSVNKDINALSQLSNDKSRQYDSFNSTKNVLKSIRLKSIYISAESRSSDLHRSGYALLKFQRSSKKAIMVETKSQKKRKTSNEPIGNQTKGVLVHYQKLIKAQRMACSICWTPRHQDP